MTPRRGSRSVAISQNVICPDRITPQAAALLQYYPAPNITATGRQGYNYQTITTAGNNAETAALRYVRNFGQNSGGFFGGGRRQAANAPKTLRQNINFNGSYSHTAADNRNIFLPLGGKTETNGYGVTAGYTIGYGRLTNNASINWNRSHSYADELLYECERSAGRDGNQHSEAGDRIGSWNLLRTAE